MRNRPATLVAGVTALAVGLVIVIVMASGDAPDACAPVEQVVEGGALHLLPGVEVTYEHSPPTSGPHELPAPAGGVSPTPIPEPRQVAFVETGGVILQYDRAVDGDDVAALEALASESVLVAPAVRPFDDDARVAFTAWSNRQLCDAVSIDAAENFIGTYAGAYFVNHDD